MVMDAPDGPGPGDGGGGDRSAGERADGDRLAAWVRGGLVVVFGAAGLLLLYTAALSVVLFVSRGPGRAGAPGGGPLTGHELDLVPVALSACAAVAVAAWVVLVGGWGPDVLERWKRRGVRDLDRMARTTAAGLRGMVEGGRWRALTLVLLVTGGAALRLLYLGQPVRYDEAVTFLQYAPRPPGALLTSYDLPNNHLLHSLLVHLVSWLGGSRPELLRLPALVAGVAVLPAAWAWARSLLDRDTALITTGILAASAPLVLFSTNGRGYSLVVLCFVLLLGLGTHLARRSNVIGWALFAVVAAVGAHTIPLMLYPFAAVVAWLLLAALFDPGARGRELLREMGLAVAATGLLTLWLYLPVFQAEGFAAVFANRFVEASSWSSFTSSVPGFLGDVWAQWHRGLPTPVGVLLAVAGGGGAAWLAWRRRVGPGLLFVGALTATALLLLASRRTTYPRVFLFLLPLYAVLVAHGIAVAARWLAGRIGSPGAVGPAAAGLVATGLAGGVVLGGSVTGTDATGRLPAVDRIVRELEPRLDPGDSVAALVPSDAPLKFYFLQRGIPLTHLRKAPRRGGELFIVVNREAGQTLEGFSRALGLTPANTTEPERIAAYDGAALYRVGVR